MWNKEIQSGVTGVTQWQSVCLHVAQMGEHQPSKCKALSSIPVLPKKIVFINILLVRLDNSLKCMELMSSCKHF
jgi:hypothetical protein